MTMRSALRALILGAVMAVLPATGASADVLRADEAVPRICHETGSGQAAGIAERRYTPAAGGLLTIRLKGSEAAGDWDLAAFRVSDNRLLGASSSFGSAETVVARAQAGEEVAIRACRRLGGGHTVSFTIDLYELAFPQPGGTAQLVEVPVGGARGLARLEDTGADVTHDVTVRNGIGFAKVVVYSAAEHGRLADAGFPARVLVSDLRALDGAQRRAEARAPAPPAQRALPSARTTYREPHHYSDELKALAEENPGLVRELTLPAPSLEGRPIEGVEIATEVNRTDDGRPVYVQLGLHHAREWPSGEFPMEFALDLVESFKAGDPRVTALLGKVRVVVLPMMNPDGFAVSRGAGEPTAVDDDPDATLALSLNDEGAYKRKNCRPAVAGDPVPCAMRAPQGVDLNRNYGAFYGGAGTSTTPNAQNFRGAGPYSEPESEAFHRFSSTRQITEVISNHTFTDAGVFLRQPGFQADFFPENAGGEDISPDEAGMKALGDAMAAATGWESALGWKLSDITGATEDWNYFAQGSFGYTPEAKGPNFHANYTTWVIEEYEGKGPLAGKGVREAFLLAGEQAANPADHSVIEGRAAPGRVLRLRKGFATATSLDGVVVDDTLDTTLTVPADGTYEWHVNPSKRPLFATQAEAWTMTCETAGGAVLSTARVDVARGQRVTQNICPAGAGPGGGSGPAACDAPTGRLGARRLDRVRLGAMRRVPRAAFARRESGGRTVDRFCLTGPGSLRVGYPGASLPRRLSARERSRVGGRAVLLLTSSPRYALRGVRPGAASASLPGRVARARGIRIGVNTWYLLRGRRARVVIKVRRGSVGEVGLADLRLTRGRARATRFLRSFR